MDEIVIQVNQLTKQFGNIKAVNNISFQVHKGDVFGFLGPNGAGKTTTMGMLLGLITPTAGEGTILGNSIFKEQHLIKPRIGAVIENPSFYPFMSGFDNLKAMFYASGLKPNTATIKEKLELVGLSDRAKSKFKTYSLGMKQRLGLAAILLTNPDIIFLDEPNNGLDPAGQKEIRELIFSLVKDKEKTVFISSHQLMEIEKICNRVAVIQKGNIVKTGSTKELLHTNQGVYVQTQFPQKAIDLLAAKGITANLSSERNFNLFVLVVFEVIPNVLEILVDGDCQIFAVEPHKISLEDLFLELTEVKK
jgi:ABC-type multidrug transport system ATPase subunit